MMNKPGFIHYKHLVSNMIHAVRPIHQPFKDGGHMAHFNIRIVLVNAGLWAKILIFQHETGNGENRIIVNGRIETKNLKNICTLLTSIAWEQ